MFFTPSWYCIYMKIYGHHLPVNVCIADIIHRSTRARMLMLGFPRALYSSCASLREHPSGRIRPAPTQATLTSSELSQSWAAFSVRRSRELFVELHWSSLRREPSSLASTWRRLIWQRLVREPCVTSCRTGYRQLYDRSSCKVFTNSPFCIPAHPMS